MKLGRMPGATPSTDALSDAHRKALEVESGITPEVIAARGYCTVTDHNELYRLGFSPKQCRLVPGLLIPIYTPDGGNSLYRFRPDKPRNLSQKYEQPKGEGLRLDCNPRAIPVLADPKKPLAFVEGEKKADALLSRSLAAIALPGVYGFKAHNKFNGVTLSADFDYIALEGRTVYIIFDSDAATNPNVSQAEARLAEHLRRKGADVKIIRLPDANGKKQGADNYLVAGHSLDDLLALVIDNPATLHPSFANVNVDGLPGIKINGRHLRETSADALKALTLANNPPYFFVRSGTLVRVQADEHDRPTIETVTESILCGRLARVANFHTVKKVDGEMISTPHDPPLDVLRDLMAAGQWDLPPLESIIECPALRPDGTVIDQRGYDPATNLYYFTTDGQTIGNVPHSPTADDMKAALSLMREAIGDFPYTDESSEANALGLLLTPNLRPAIKGCVPLALVDAPQQGTGKTLLASTVTQISNGHDPAIITAPKDSDEWRKKITSALLTGAPVITIDNLSGPLYAGELAAALTTGVWADRLLGGNDMINLPQRATWIATGNNIRLGGDLPRRCYWIRLDAKLSRPWQRTGFQHHDLPGWVAANRGRLLAAALTLARAWYAAGCPDGNAPTMGGFSEWTRVVGGVLAHAGVKGFLGNLEEMYETADDDGPQWEVFLTALHKQFKSDPVTVAEICEKIVDDSELAESVPDMLDLQFDKVKVETVDSIGNVKFKNKNQVQAGFKKKLGKALAARNGTRYGDTQVRVEKRADDTHAKVLRWRLACRGVCGVCGFSSNPNQNEKGNSNILNNDNNTDNAPGLAETHPANPANPATSSHPCPTLPDPLDIIQPLPDPLVPLPQGGSEEEKTAILQTEQRNLTEGTI